MIKEIKRCCGVEQGQPHLKGCPTGQKITEPLITFVTDYIMQGVLREYDDLYDLYLEISG